MLIDFGASVTGTINSGGTISSGSNPNVVSSGQTLIISNGQTSTGVTVLSGGQEIVLSGGTASATTVSGGGFEQVGSGWPGGRRFPDERRRPRIGERRHGDRHDRIRAGQTRRPGRWRDSNVLLAGIASNGGYANETVSNGGLAVSTTILSGGVINISSGGVVSNAFGNGGNVWVSSGGLAVSGCGDQQWHLRRRVHPRWRRRQWQPGVGRRLRVDPGPGGKHRDQGRQWIRRRHRIGCGIALGTVVSRGGGLSVSAGGLASGAVLSSGGFEGVSAGGIASGTRVSGGFLSVQGGLVVDTVLAGVSGAFAGAAVSSGGIASGTVVLSSGGISVSSGGMDVGTILSSGGETVSFGGVASNTTAFSAGNVTVSSGGVAIGTTLNGGFENLLSGATASGHHGEQRRQRRRVGPVRRWSTRPPTGSPTAPGRRSSTSATTSRAAQP